MFKEYPSFKVIAENEPALWEKVREEMVGVYQANGSQMDTKVAQQMAAIFRPLNDRLKKVGAAADADHILNWMTAESTLINHLMQENVALCAEHLLGTSFDQTEPSQLTVSLQRQVQAAMMEACKRGKTPGTQVQQSSAPCDRMTVFRHHCVNANRIDS